MKSLRVKISILAAMLLMISSAEISAHQKTWPGRQLQQTFAQATRFTSQQATLSGTQIEQIERILKTRLTPEDRRPIFYPAYRGNQKIGWVVFVDETGDYGPMEIGVAMDNDGRIAAVKMLEHRENRAIERKEFLEQFNGKAIGDVLKLDEQVPELNEAPQASRAVIRAVKKALLLKQAIYGK
jgi:transcriptional regulator of nitric oxide reductase